MCSTCKDLCHMFALQACTWNKILLVQWIICHWQIHCSFGASRICLCSEYNVQKSSEVAWRRRDGKLQRLLWSSICPWCYKHDTNTHSETQRNIYWNFFFLWHPSHITCNYKLLLTTKRSSHIFLWACPTPWIMVAS